MKIINNEGKWYLLKESGGEIEVTPLDTEKSYEVKSIGNVRTTNANRALHMLFTMYATELNNAGYDVKHVLGNQKSTLIHKTFEWLKTKAPESISFLDKAEARLSKEEEVSIPWTGELFKNLVWRVIQKAMVAKDSTTKIDSKDIDLIYRTVDKIMSDRYGITLPFPSIDQMLFDKKKENK